MTEARRRFRFNDRSPDRAKRVVEPELDMNRLRPDDSSWAGYLREVLRWLLPGTTHAAKAPKRSIGRELEEEWPSSER